MHWTDPFNEINKSAPQYAEAGLKLIRLLRSEGWKPGDMDALADQRLIDIRKAVLESIRSIV